MLESVRKESLECGGLRLAASRDVRRLSPCRANINIKLGSNRRASFCMDINLRQHDLSTKHVQQDASAARWYVAAAGRPYSRALAARQPVPAGSHQTYNVFLPCFVSSVTVLADGKSFDFLNVRRILAYIFCDLATSLYRSCWSGKLLTYILHN